MSGEADCDGEYNDVARENLGLTEGSKSNFKKFDLETLAYLAENTAEEEDRCWIEL